MLLVVLMCCVLTVECTHTTQSTAQSHFGLNVDIKAEYEEHRGLVSDFMILLMGDKSAEQYSG